MAALAGCALIANGQCALSDEITLSPEDITPIDSLKTATSAEFASEEENSFTLGDVSVASEIGGPIGYSAASENNGIYTLTPATADDYDYKTDTINADGSVTTNYYKITLNASGAGTAENITWTQVDTAGENTISVMLPNGETAYLAYSYAAPDGYTTTTTRVTSPSTSNTTKMVFSGISNNLTYTASSDYGSGGTYSGSDDSDSTAKVENTFSTTTPGVTPLLKPVPHQQLHQASSYISCSADASASSSRSNIWRRNV